MKNVSPHIDYANQALRLQMDSLMADWEAFLSGGAGVYLARTLYRWLNDSTGFDDKYSCHQHNISFRQSNIAQDIHSSATVYPNPADDLLHVTLSNRQIEAIFVLYNTLGQCVVKQEMEDALQISTNNLSNGIYYWEIQTEGQHKHAGKVIIQH